MRFCQTTMASAMAVLLSVAAAVAADWPQYRGPERTGISAETGLQHTWPAAGPEILWRAPLGGGYSGVAVVGEQVFTMYSREDAEYVACFAADTGKELWRTRVDGTRRDDQGSGPRSTPTVDRGMVFALSAGGNLVAVRAGDGHELWARNLKKEFGAPVPRWGVSTSPLVEGEMLLLDAGGPGSSLVALDRKTGETRWTAYDDRPGYSAPIAATILGTRQILSFAGTSLVSVRADDGTVLWKVPWKTSYDVNAAVPILVAPDKVFLSSGYDKGAGLFRVRNAENGWKVEEIWRSRVMKNHFNSSILHEGHIYGFDNGTLKCIEAGSGQEKWSHRGFSKGSLILADGHLIVLGESGQLALVEATPTAYKEKSSVQILRGRTWTMPSLAGGRLYLRNREELIALDIAK